MTLKSTILGLSPAIYWPLDDATGPTIADATGNGHSGFATANTSLLATGPEPGTDCMATSSSFSGVQLLGANPLTGTGPFSFVVWIGLASLSVGDNELIYNGISNQDGEGLLLGTNNQVRIIRGGLEVVSAGGLISAGVWHMLAHTFNTSGNRLTYVDGTLTDTHAAGIPNTVSAGDWCRAFTPAAGLLAHAAFWTSVISGANISNIWSAGPGANHAAAVNQAGVVTAGQLVTAIDLLNLIYAAVHKTY